MNARTNRRRLPNALVEILDDLDASTLRTVRTHVDQRLDDLRPTTPEVIRSETEGEIVEITDGRPYTLVRKRPPSGEGADTGPRPLSLYRVKRAKRLNGEETLRWSYLGDVTEPDDVERGNCGGPLNGSTAACPHCGEELTHDEEA